ncbi:MAG: hypothetical protein KDC38_14340, partial [Planctomycetes bacterium]|nr:hypothetical protein [Planctomycetota bacterium]
MSASAPSSSDPRESTPRTAALVLSSFGLTPEQLDRVRWLGELESVDPSVLVHEFYRWLQSRPRFASFFGGGIPDWVRGAQTQYWREFLRANVDDAYVASRLSVGATHARIELSPEAYSTSMAFCQRWLFERLERAELEPADTRATAAAVAALCQLDSALVMEAYSEHSRRRTEAESRKSAAILDEVSRVMSEASSGNFEVRYAVQVEADAPLAEAVNQMIEGVATTIRQAKAIAAGDL